jgi:hypothetical protein
MTKWRVVLGPDGKAVASGWTAFNAADYGPDYTVEEHDAPVQGRINEIKAMNEALVARINSDRASARAKLKALGLTDAEVNAL